MHVVFMNSGRHTHHITNKYILEKGGEGNSLAYLCILNCLVCFLNFVAIALRVFFEILFVCIFIKVFC